MHRECRERFPRRRGLAIPTCITARASRDACRDRYPVVSFEIGGGENVPGIPGACATRNFTYLVRGPYGDIDPGRHWLVAWWHQAITWTNVDLSSNVLCGIHMIPLISISKMGLKITFHKWLHISQVPISHSKVSKRWERPSGRPHCNFVRLNLRHGRLMCSLNMHFCYLLTITL